MAKAKRPAPDSVRDIASGAVHVSADRLFALIHDVNPTGRNVSERDRERRYREKSALQSVLVREHAESLRFETDAGEGVVTIRHADLGYDACHAVLDELDLDARAIVRRKLDELAAERGAPAPFAARPAARGGRKAAGGDPLEDGRRALAEYDYDAARAAFEAALAQSGGGVDAAVALLELLVDQLADDQSALELVPRLGDAAKKAPWIRMKLGTAAARRGQVEEAARWVSGLDVEGVAEVWIACAEASLLQGQLERAQEWLQRAAKLDPHAGADTKRRVAAARAESLRALERELEELVDRGAESEARTRAEAILARFPESREARGHLAAVAERDQQRRGEAQLERARQTASRGDVDTALSILLGELEHQSGPFKATLEAEVETLRLVAARTRNEAAVERILARRTSDLRGALAELAGSTPAVRAEVRRRAPDPAFDIADTLSGLDTDDRVASASLAIAEILRAPMDASNTVRSLEPYRALVSKIATANELLRRATAALREEALQLALASIDATKDALSSGDGPAARDHLRAIDRTVLDAATRAAVVDLEAQADALLEIEQLDAAIVAARKRGDLFSALDTLDRREAARPADAQRNAAIRAELEAAVDEHHQVLVVDGPFEAWAAFVHLGQDSNQIVLRSDRDELVLTGGAGDETCLHLVDARTGALRRTLLAKTGGGQDAAVFGDVAYISGFSPAITIIDLGTLRLKRVAQLPRRAGRVDDFAIAADEHVYIWMSDDRRGAVTVARIDRPDATRTLASEDVILRRLHASTHERVLCANFDDGAATIYTAGGRAVGKLKTAYPIDGAEPDGLGGLVVVAAESHDEGDVALAQFDAQGKLLASRALDDVHPEMARCFAVDPAQGLAYLRYRSLSGDTRMAAYDYRSPELPARFDVRCDPKAVFVTDRAASRVLAVHRQGEELVVQSLPAAPVYPARDAEIPPAAYWEGTPHDCEWKPPIGPAGHAAVEAFRALPYPERAERARRLADELGDDLGAKIAIVELFSRREEGFDATVEALLGAQWDAPAARMLRIAHLLDAAKWEQARELAMRTDGVPQQLDAHRRHLLAVAYAGRGEIDLAQWSFDPVFPGCPAAEELSPYLARLKAIAQGQEDSSALALLVTALRDSDQAIRVGDLEAAWRILNVPDLWASRALQHVARAAHCVIELPATTPALQVRRRLVTAALRERWRDRKIWRANLLLGGTWSQERIREVAKRAGAPDAD